VSVNGDRAKVMLSDGGRKPVPTLVTRQDGEWKITTIGNGGVGSGADAAGGL
jgi:hypothetical protein